MVTQTLPKGNCAPDRRLGCRPQRTQPCRPICSLQRRPVLHDLDERYDMCRSNLIARFGPVMPLEAVDSIAAAHERWRSSDHRSAVALLWPTIEPIVRSMCPTRGLTTAARKSTSFPQTRPLGELLNDLAPHIDRNYANMFAFGDSRAGPGTGELRGRTAADRPAVSPATHLIWVFRRVIRKRVLHGC